MIKADIALCIPAYNAAAFLPRLLASAQAQTVPFAEILVYDDASTDNTAAVAAAAGARVVRGETNRGCSSGKNILAQATSSSWLHFHDADDALEPNFVETAHPWINRADSPDVIFFNYRTFEDDTKRLLGTREFDGAALRADALAYCLAEQINPFCGLYRRKPFLAAGGWDEDFKVLQSEDQAGHLRLALAGLRFDADPTYTVINFIRSGSMTTSNLAGAQRSTYHLLVKAAAAAPARYHTIIARRLWSTAGLSAAFNDWENADRAAALALQLAPTMEPPGGLLMRVTARYFPRLTLRIRERLIRICRPAQRSGNIFHGPPKIRSGT